MADVVIAGMGQTEVGEHWNIGLRDLAFAAIQNAVRDAGGLKPQSLIVGNMLAPNLSNQAHLGVLLADYAGLLGIENGRAGNVLVRFFQRHISDSNTASADCRPAAYAATLRCAQCAE